MEENADRMTLAKEVMEKKLSVRATEERVAQFKREAALQPGAKIQAPSQATKDPFQQRIHHLSQELTRALATRVELKGGKKRGRIVVHYTSPNELERIVSTLQN